MTKPKNFRLIEQATSASQIEDISPIADASYTQILRPNPEPPQASPRIPPTAASGAQPAHEPLGLYFGLEIIDDAENHDNVDASDLDIRPKTPRLEFNKRYRVRVTAGTDGSREMKPLLLRHDAKLIVGISEGGDDGIYMPARTCPLSYDSADGFMHDFELSLLPDCKRRNVTFVLVVRVHVGSTAPQAEQVVVLEGIPVPPAEQFEAAGMDPELRYPPTVGTLIFQEQNGESISATCFNEYSPTPELTLHFAKPKYDKVAEFPKNISELEHYVSHFRRYVRLNSEINKLTKWLETLVGLHRDQLVINITDLTSSNLPWEMLELRGLGQDQFLGALASIVRRLPAQKWHYVDSHYQGAGLGYVDPELRRATEKRNALNSAGVSLFGSFDELKRHLLGLGVGGSALVFLDCHGAFTYTADELSDEQEIALGTSLAGQRITVLDLENLPVHYGERPLFVANACHSAKLLKDPTSGLYGLPEALLDKCASGYIGTLGPIDERPALDMTYLLTSEINSLPGGLHAADFLRRLRSNAAGGYSAHRGHQDEERFRLTFIYTFMYVYYGDPLARWSLQSQSNVGPQSGVAV